MATTQTIVLDYSQAYEHYDLAQFIDDLYSNGDGDDIVDLTLSMFEGDPDLIRINGEQTTFIDVDVDGVKYVLYIEHIEGIENALSGFFEENYKEHYTGMPDAGWDDFNELENGIAYRGGSGYNYAIYSF